MANLIPKKRTFRIRVYSKGEAEYSSHGYCVDDFPLRVCLVVGEVVFDPSVTTFKQLRPMIEYNTSGHMNRRSVMFQEVLFIMSKLPNLYARSNKFRYGFGHVSYVSNDVESIPVVYPEDSEDQPIVALIPSQTTPVQDLYIIPYTQVNINI
mmetsp:Transcript_26201/g.26444  ORF Transcript_26201/g.26444 Transcript_26201/m.26444 type:complete len:152 (+) Transcript_26201:268-723(+)